MYQASYGILMDNGMLLKSLLYDIFLFETFLKNKYLFYFFKEKGFIDNQGFIAYSLLIHLV